MKQDSKVLWINALFSCSVSLNALLVSCYIPPHLDKLISFVQRDFRRCQKLDFDTNELGRTATRRQKGKHKVFVILLP